MNAIRVVGGLFCLLCLCLTIPLLAFSADSSMGDNDSSAGWQYDDYLESSPGDVVDGEIFELVELGSKKYIHAKSVGTGAINGIPVTVNKAVLDLIFSCGQSNATYRNPDIETASPLPKYGTGYYFGTSTKVGAGLGDDSCGIDIATQSFQSMYDDTGKLKIGGKSPSFTTRYNMITGHKVYWVNGAVGAKSIEQFLPPSSQMWTYMDNMLTSAINAVDTERFNLNVHYYLWIQGEINAEIDIEEYMAAFLQMHDAMLGGECGGTQFKGCVISLVRPINAPNPAEAQLRLAQNHETITMGSVSSQTFTIDNGCVTEDDLHYSQLGNNRLGWELGECIAKLEGFTICDNDSEQRSVLVILSMVLVLLAVGAISLKRH